MALLLIIWKNILLLHKKLNSTKTISQIISQTISQTMHNIQDPIYYLHQMHPKKFNKEMQLVRIASNGA